MGFRPGMMAAVRIQVILEVRYSASPNPEAVNARRTLFAQTPSLQSVVLKDVSNVGDAALWDWTNIDGGTGRLVAYKSGTTEVFVTIVGISENAAIAGAKKLAMHAIGSEKTGYTYASAHREQTKCDEGHFPIWRCQTATDAWDSLQSPKSPKDPGELMRRLSQARSQFFATYKKQGYLTNSVYLNARDDLRFYLNDTDFIYVYIAIDAQHVGSASGDTDMKANVLSVMGGAMPISVAIPSSTRHDFDTWVSSVSNRLPFQGISDVLNIQSRLHQALIDTEPQYERYVAARERAEFASAGKTLP